MYFIEFTLHIISTILRFLRNHEITLKVATITAASAIFTNCK